MLTKCGSCGKMMLRHQAAPTQPTCGACRAASATHKEAPSTLQAAVLALEVHGRIEPTVLADGTPMCHGGCPSRRRVRCELTGEKAALCQPMVALMAKKLRGDPPR